MKKRMIIFSFILWSLSLVQLSCTEMRLRQSSDLWDEAIEIWKGQYTPADLVKWEKRLEKLGIFKRPGISLSLNVIGVMHYHDGNLDEALRFLNQSLQISRQHGLKNIITIDLYWIGTI